MATYVDLSLANNQVGICVTHSFSSLTQFDYSAYSSYFTNVPELLNLLIIPDSTVAASTNNDEILVLDNDPNTGAYSFSYSALLNNATGSPINVTGPELTFSSIPYDFDAVTNFNVWLTPNGTTSINQVTACILGYWY